MKRESCFLIAVLSLSAGLVIGRGSSRFGVANPPLDQPKKGIAQEPTDKIRIVIDPRIIDLVLVRQNFSFSGNTQRFVMEFHGRQTAADSSVDRLFQENRTNPLAGRMVSDIQSELSNVTSIQADPSRFVLTWEASDPKWAVARVDANSGRMKSIEFMGVDPKN